MELYRVTHGDGHSVEIGTERGKTFAFEGKPIGVEFAGDRRQERIIIAGKTFNIFVRSIDETHYEVWINHHVLKLKVEDERAQLLGKYESSAASSHESVLVSAPMPGLVLGVAVKLGEEVPVGAKLLTLEAMKMENELRAPIAGEITYLNVSKGTIVEKDQPLIKIQATEK